MSRNPFPIFVLALALLPAGCSPGSPHQPFHDSGAAQPSAPSLMTQYGCPTCHVIPHVAGAIGKVGPSLQGLHQRSYLAGTLPNTPSNLEQWIMHPQHFHPGSAMPEMGIPEADGHTIAIFLLSTR